MAVSAPPPKEELEKASAPQDTGSANAPSGGGNERWYHKVAGKGDEVAITATRRAQSRIYQGLLVSQIRSAVKGPGATPLPNNPKHNPKPQTYYSKQGLADRSLVIPRAVVDPSLPQDGEGDSENRNNQSVSGGPQEGVDSADGEAPEGEGDNQEPQPTAVASMQGGDDEDEKPPFPPVGWGSITHFKQILHDYGEEALEIPEVKLLLHRMGWQVIYTFITPAIVLTLPAATTLLFISTFKKHDLNPIYHIFSPLQKVIILMLNIITWLLIILFFAVVVVAYCNFSLAGLWDQARGAFGADTF